MSPIREILGVGERRPAGGIIFPRGAMPDTVLATTDIPQTSSAGVNASVSGSITPTESSFSSSLLARTSAANMARYKVAKSFMQPYRWLSIFSFRMSAKENEFRKAMRKLEILCCFGFGVR